MGKHSKKFIRNVAIIFVACILFVFWQNNENPNGAFLNYLFGTSFLTVGVMVSGFLSILGAIEDSKGKKEKTTNDKGKEVLKG